MVSPEARPEGEQAPPRPHLDAGSVRAARLRAQLSARRARHAMDDITDTGRVAGRVATTLNALPETVPLDGPAVALLLLPDIRAIEIVDAAAASLHGHDLAAGIGRSARLEADSILGPEARAFALAHRNFARPPTGLPIGDLIDEARAEVAHLWADRLPIPLCDEFRPAVPRPRRVVVEAAVEEPEPVAEVEPVAEDTSAMAQVRATARSAGLAARAAAMTAGALAARARRVKLPWDAAPIALARGTDVAEPSARADLALDAALAALLPQTPLQAKP